MYLNLKLLNNFSVFSVYVYLYVLIVLVCKRVEWIYLFLDFIYFKVNFGGIIFGYEF